jgi:hypothetical protein
MLFGVPHPFGKVRFEDGVETWVHPQATSELDLLLSEKPAP